MGQRGIFSRKSFLGQSRTFLAESLKGVEENNSPRKMEQTS